MFVGIENLKFYDLECDIKKSNCSFVRLYICIVKDASVWQ